MKDNLTKAIEILNGGKYTCVLCRDDKVYTSTKRGVKPLLEWLEGGMDLRDFSAADKVVGKAAAFLYVLLGVEEVYAHVMSEAAIDILAGNHIHPQWEVSVKKIINRAGTGFCPMEEAVWDIESPKEAKQAIENKLEQLENRKVF